MNVKFYIKSVLLIMITNNNKFIRKYLKKFSLFYINILLT